MRKQYWCNTHGIFYGFPCVIPFGEGYYVNDRIMQKTDAMQGFFDEMQEVGITQSFGWIICEKCVDRLGLTLHEKETAKKAAMDRWTQ